MHSGTLQSARAPFGIWCGYLLYFVLFALPISFAIADILLDLKHYQTYRVRREFTGYCEVILIVLLLWGAIKSWRVFDWRVPALMVVPLFILVGHSLAFPDDDNARALWRWTLIFLFALVFYGAVAGGTIAITARGVVTSFVAGASLYTVFALVYHFGWGNLSELNSNNLVGFGNVRASNRLLVPALMCAIVAFALPEAAGRRRWFFLAAALILAMLSGYTGSRSTIMALVSISILAALLSPRFRYLRIAAATVAVIAIGLALASLVPTVIQLLASTENVEPGKVSQSLQVFRYSSSGRVMIWETILELALQRPAFGWGGADFTADRIRQFSNAHNIIIQVFYEVGLAGLIPMAILAASFLLRSLKIVRAPRPDMYVTAAALSACAIMASSLVAPGLWFQYSAFLFVVLAVVALVRPGAPGEADPLG
ncbi:O-antigen ligase family protein [Notoacmeibacter ruber]|nr:O-antigen ligase family protein [Notoacmeibacter ruber]